ncbi:hypothetical protein PF010_g29261 [Phytophthora fragariae]|uniref:Uncharacterized protein n=1 Tax=Phytophthora fragariae TaxID=53985 RepID=A0A6G0JP85_9STRA|nr:hypothetical protein PF010_g29261 [Phytophthora fragariae]
MRRRERANVVVLSSEEKYCYAKAAFEPVMEHLAGLPRPAFYAALRSWKQIVLRGMEEVGASSSDATSTPDESSGSDKADSLDDNWEIDTASDIAPADLIDSMNMIRELEETEHDLSFAAAELNCVPTQKDVPLVENMVVGAEASDVLATNAGSDAVKNNADTTPQTLTQSWGRIRDEDSAVASPPNAKGFVAKTEKKALLTKAAVRTNVGKNATKDVRKHGLIEVLKLPQPKPRRNQRKKLTQSRVKTNTATQKWSVLTLPDKQIPELDRVLEWARNTADKDHVSEILTSYLVLMTDDFWNARTARCQHVQAQPGDFDYNFVVPNRLVIKLDAVLRAETRKRSPSTYFASVVSAVEAGHTPDEVVAFFSAETPKFSSVAGS